MARVTGIGGVFLKARDPKGLAKWYAESLGFTLNQYFNGINFEWSDEVPATTGSTVWSLFAEDTKHFGGGPQSVMLNFRVDDLDGLIEKLSAANVPIDPKRDDSEFGKFAWITDPEGNRVELWQPLVEQAATSPENS